MSRWPMEVLVVAVSLTVLAGCMGSSASNADHLVLGDPRTSGLKEWPGMFVAPLTHYDLNGDGTQEIIAHSTDRTVYVFDSTGGQVLARLETTYPRGWYVQQILNGVEVGVLAPGEPPSLVVTNHAAYISVWTFDAGASRDDAFVFDKKWEVRADRCYHRPGMDASPVLADLTGDGRQEILVHTEERGLYAFRASDGKELWGHCWGGGNGPPAVGDVNGDGKTEAVFASDSGQISVFDGKSGNPLWTFDVTKHGIKPGSVPAAPTLADLNGDGRLAVLVTARHAPADDPSRFDSFHMGIFAVHQNPDTWQAELLWMLQPEWANPMSYAELVVHEVDGEVGIFGVDWNTIGHRPGNWENLGPANAFRLNAQGEVVWVREVRSWWSNKDVAIADLDGDGSAELLVNGERGGTDGVWRLDLEDGRSLGFFGVDGFTLIGGPQLFDARGDGSMHMMYRVTPLGGSEGRGAVLVFDLGVPFHAPVRGVG